MNRDGDAELVRRCLAGEGAAYEALLTEYEKPVYNVAFRMLHNVDDAQDVTQTVFMKVFENLDRYQGKNFINAAYRVGDSSTNIVTPLMDAYMDSVPMVALTGNVPGALLGKDAFQEIDISGITLPMTKHNYLVRNADDIPRVVAEAFHIARTG